MSNQAAKYYSERATQHGIDTVPDILDGEPKMVFEGSVSSYSPNPDSIATINGVVGRLLTSTHDYIKAGADAMGKPLEQVADPAKQCNASLKFVDNVFTKLLVPPNFSAGKVSKIYAEAIDPTEVVPQIWRRISGAPRGAKSRV